MNTDEPASARRPAPATAESPLVLSAPLLSGGYDHVLLLASALVPAAGIAAAAARVRFPHQLGTAPERT